MLIVIFLILLYIIGIFLSGFYAFMVACRRKKEHCWINWGDIKNSPYEAYYDMIIAADEWLKMHETSDLYIRSCDGLLLHGLWIPAKEARGTLLMVHGYRSTQLIDFGLVLDYYHTCGYNLLLPDQRSHGKSEGRYITFGVKESSDIKEWISYHNLKLSECPVILCGLSMGASTVMYLADQELPSNVKGIIADCGFTSPKDIIGSVYKGITHLPPGPSLWAVDLFARMIADFGLSQKDTRCSLLNNRIPILMVHGMRDDYVPCEMTRQAFSVCAGSKELLLVEGAGHGLSYLVNKTLYNKTVDDFLKKVI